MRRTILLLFVFLNILLFSGFGPLAQASSPIISVLNHQNQTVSQITDGDNIQLQMTLPQAVAQQETISFTLGDNPVTVATCAIKSGDTACITELFLSLGWHWDPDGIARNTRVIHAKKVTGEALGQSDPITVMARPVVLVHGFLSNPETWTSYLGQDGYLTSIDLQGFAVGDGQVPGTLSTGDILNPTARTNTIAQNADVLSQYIEGVKQKTGAEMVDLVVHSMGGMISRYYIDRVMKDRDVAQLIMLGSPMGGSDCAVLPAALGFYLPASIEIRESYMNDIFNRQITHRRGIEFHDLGGTAISQAFKSPCASVPNDTVVAFGSVNAIPLQSSKIDDIHSDLTFSEKAFTNFVKPLLEKPAGTFPTEPDPAPVSPTESPLEFTRVYTGHVDAGGSTELTINIDAGLSVASFALYDASRSITTIVRGASGNIIQLTPEANGFIQVNDPSTMFYLGYGFQNPKPGPWKVTVQATATTPASGTDFAVSVYFVGGATLEATSSTLVPQIGDPVRFEANLLLGGQPLEIREARAIIRDSDRNVQTFNFSSGQNVSTTWKPTKAGTYAVDVVVTGVAPDNSIIERTNFLAIEVQPNPNKEQVTINFIAVIVVVVLILFLILFFVFRGVQGIIRRVGG